MIGQLRLQTEEFKLPVMSCLNALDAAKMYCVQWKNGWMLCLQAQLMLETAHVVCNSIVEYTEQAGVVVWRKMTAWPFEYTTL